VPSGRRAPFRLRRFLPWQVFIYLFLRCLFAFFTAFDERFARRMNQTCMMRARAL